ncbi:acyl carrier protein [Actinomadura rubrisoli]|uniref:Acyl carrier protein n=1 Tax=Actinomadura rubrisoli TaxID=2530368 RepID=A0A4V2YUW9_9ACTN|nr:acyl carrier protein [Actinomadura rubrisoli]TDD79197.1 acyl carrier protein [Actinomadura rubrisoli]
MRTTSKSAMDGVIDFLRQRSPAVDGTDWSQDLIDMRILDSLAFVEFMFLLEELSGAQIDPQMIDVENFRTLERIDRAFFGGKGT